MLQTYMQKYCLVIKKKEILLFATTWMDLKGLMLSEISQRMMDAIGSHLYVESEQEKLIELGNRLVGYRGEGEMDIGEKYKLESEDEWVLENLVWHGDYS